MTTDLITTEKLCGILSNSKRILLAVSGGADSMALLHVILQNRQKINKDIKVLHIDHGLHPDSASWAIFVSSYCRENEMPCETVSVDVAAYGKNVEQAARKARYAAFLKQGYDTVLLAHHADDQIETFFLKLFRGSGAKGLRCMTTTTPSWFDQSVTLIRPLLDKTRHDINRYVEENKVPFITDPSNNDIKYDRNWIRNRLMPFIQKRNEIADIAVLKSISIQSDAYELMCDLGRIDMDKCMVSDTELDWRKLRDLSVPRLKNLIMHICNENNVIDVSTNHVEKFAIGLKNADEDSRNEMRLKYFRMHKIGKRVRIESLKRD